MSEKPQHSREDAPDGDVIGHVFSKALDKPEKPPQEQPPAGEASPAQETKAEGKAPPAGKKNKRSSTYIYLLILFGAAFLMLLLAYFVQQRNSENAMSDLRDSMNLSREELMEEIETLEDETAALKEERDGLNTQLDELQEQYNDAASLSSAQEKELACWASFWVLEADFLAEDYEACAQWFKDAYGSNYLHFPAIDTAQQRAAEIYETLLELEYLSEEDPVMIPPAVPETPAP